MAAVEAKAPLDDVQAKASFWRQLRNLPRNFWYANFMEILERLAFFGSRAVAPLFLNATAAQNGLNLDFDRRGNIFMVWAFLQCIIPMVSGGYTDRYGYRRSLAVAFLLNAVGYFGMAVSRPLADYMATQGWPGAGYWIFMVAACFVGTGTAIFKPPVQATVAKSTTEKTSSLGWGTFYWMVNIGGALAPMAAAQLRGEVNWQYVFYAAALVTLCNFLPAFLLFQEPQRSVAAQGEAAKGPLAVFGSSVLTIFKDLRLLAFLLIVSCFWLMFMQLFDLLPNFIEQWVNTADVAKFVGAINPGWVLKSGQTKPEIVVNIDAVTIVLVCVPLSWLVGKVHKLTAMVVGMLIALLAFFATGATTIGWFCSLMVFVFAIGEIICSPTFSAYIGLIAPKERKALYMGYSQIPFAIGWAAGSKLAGRLYETFGNKFNLARHYLVEHFGLDRAWAASQDQLPNDHVMDTLARVMQSPDPHAVQNAVQTAWQQVDWNALPQDQVSQSVGAVFSRALGEVDPALVQRATQTLWDTYHPQTVWYILGAIGLIGTLGMIVFYLVARRAMDRGLQPDTTA
jgi:POT family proton-dependent oligopeptide transporter